VRRNALGQEHSHTRQYDAPRGPSGAAEPDEHAISEAAEDAFITMVRRMSVTLIVVVLTAFSLAVWRYGELRLGSTPAGASAPSPAPRRPAP
jgi:hypothetical protein